ncbi:MAG: carbon-nitrogen hydrolase [Rhodothermales bacterium]|nr:carbon-nitrogen hydrolase [Rhodothermales bacterium]MBO6778176.1 carbon-nitrogen hydrolase [Rhodothermales bacterium]
MSIVRIGLVQLQMSDDVEANLDQAEALTRQAAEAGAQVVCLPELFASRYFCQTEDPEYFKLAEPVPGPTTDRFERIAAEFDVTMVLSLFEARAPGLYHNTAAVVDGRAGYLGKYRKMHIPDDPRYYEKYYFTPGDLGYRVFDTRHGRIGVLICWDQWYPEAARLTALQGADILFYPTAIGWHPDERDSHGAQQHGAWEVIQRSHAVANGCFVAAVNRTGFEPDPTAPAEGIQFWGQSFLAGPDGSIVEKLPVDEPSVRVVEIDRGRIAEQRHGWPFLRDRRIDSYSPLNRRFLDD